MKLSDTFTVVDVETTGPNPDRDRIIQIGWAEFVGLEFIQAGARLVNPGVEYDRGKLVAYGQDGVGVEVPRGAYEVHGIGLVDLQGQPRYPEVIAKLGWGENLPIPTLVTYNGAHFDVPVFENESRFYDVPCPLPSAHVDVFTFVGWYYRGWRSRKLSDVTARLGIRARDDQALHAADVDCQLTGQLLSRLVVAGVVPDDVDDAMKVQGILQAALREEDRRYRYWFYEDRVDGRLRMGCGRHTGKLVEDVPKKEWVNLFARTANEDLPPLVVEKLRELAS